MSTVSLTAPFFKQALPPDPSSGKFQELIDQADSYFLSSIKYLGELQKGGSSPERKAKFLGRFIQIFREFDNLCSDFLRYPLHRYCCCHILEKGVDPSQASSQLKAAISPVQGKEISWVPYPDSFLQESSLNGRSSILFSWSLGGGHNVVRDAYSKRLAREQMHVYRVGADKEVLDKFDLLLKLTRGNFSGADLYNLLLKNKCWRSLQFLDWMFKGEKPETQQLKINEFSLSILKHGVPDLAITCFDRVVGSIEKACSLAGIPILSIATDFEPDFSDIQVRGDVKNPYFIRSIMTSKQDELVDGIARILTPKQIRFGGLPVRDAFLKDYSLEYAALRRKWDVAFDAQVVVLLSGGEGVKNQYAERIVDYYKTSVDDLPKIHLFVLCGKNKEQQKYLLKTLSDLDEKRIQVRILGWTEETEMGELEALAAQERNRLRGAVVSTKGGGGSLSEAAAIGAPILVCDSNPISWEKKNVKYICAKKLGMKFEKERELMVGLVDILNSPYTPLIQYGKFDSSRISIRLVQELIGSSDRDQVFQAFKTRALQIKR